MRAMSRYPALRKNKHSRAITPIQRRDANGNLTSDGVFAYAYDAANQLTNVVRLADGSRVLSARYDALGRRVEATRADGSVERYVYFPGSFLVLAVLDGSNAVKEVYTRGPDLNGSPDGAGGIGGILACIYASGATYYYHADIMGNVVALTDASGSVVSTFRYTPFGQLSARTGTVLPRYLFSSKEFDRTANLYYYGYRYYAPRMGRWIIRDPIGENGEDIQLYRMVKNLPLILHDSVGLSATGATQCSKSFDGWKHTGCDEGEIHMAGARAARMAAKRTAESLKSFSNVIDYSNQGYEYSGAICCKCEDLTVYITGPVKGTTRKLGHNTLVDTASTPQTSGVPCYKGDKMVGFYHSHPYGNNVFSKQDIQFSAKWRIPLYLQSAEVPKHNPIVVLPYAELEDTTRNTKHGTISRGMAWIGKAKYVYEIDCNGNLTAKSDGVER